MSFEQLTPDKILAAVEQAAGLRMIHYLLWCSRQKDDFLFNRNFPEWGSDSFWQREIADVWEQAGWYIEDAALGSD